MLHRIMAVRMNGLCWIELAYDRVHCRTSVLIRCLFSDALSTTCCTASKGRKSSVKAGTCEGCFKAVYITYLEEQHLHGGTEDKYENRSRVQMLAY